MAQPKKLTAKQKQAKKELQQLNELYQNILRIRQAMRHSASSAFETWRWASLNVYNDLCQLSIRHETHKWALYKEHALDTAREAQAALNFTR